MKKYHIRNINGIDADESGTVTIAIPLQVLEKLTEGVNSGIVIRGRDPLKYGEIGSDAVDLSYSTTNSSLYGATGRYSFASGDGADSLIQKLSIEIRVYN